MLLRGYQHRWPGRRTGLAAELAAQARAWRLPPVAAWFRVSLATPPPDLRFAWAANSAVHGEFMNFREQRIIAAQMAKTVVRDTGIELAIHR
jgi:hypothetical protein